MSSEFGIVIHGGAGTILRMSLSAKLEAQYRERLQASLTAGFEILNKGGLSLDAVCAAVNVMEDSPLFNAGKGAVFTNEGTNEQDASVMDGSTLECGGVASVKRIKNPVDLARQVMEKSEHVLLCGDGAEAFATKNDVELVEADYFHTEMRWKQLQKALEKEKRLKTDYSQLDHSPDDKHGTVGAVALDKEGNLAAATSSGGMTNKRFSRIGDSPIIGAGNYANNATCAVSTTGHGEYFMRCLTAYDVSAMMEYKQMTLTDAAEMAIMTKLTDLGGTGGLIAIDRQGNIALPFNTPGMYRGHRLANAEPAVAIFKE